MEQALSYPEMLDSFWAKTTTVDSSVGSTGMLGSFWVPVKLSTGCSSANLGVSAGFEGRSSRFPCHSVTPSSRATRWKATSLPSLGRILRRNLVRSADDSWRSADRVRRLGSG